MVTYSRDCNPDFATSRASLSAAAFASTSKTLDLEDERWNIKHTGSRGCGFKLFEDRTELRVREGWHGDWRHYLKIHRVYR